MLLWESSQPSLAHPSRKGAVGLKWAPPEGIQVATTSSKALIAKHPNSHTHTLQHVSTLHPLFLFKI